MRNSIFLWRHSWLVLLLLVFAAGCPVSVPKAANLVFACSSDSDCIKDFVCHKGTCQRKSSIADKLDASSIDVESGDGGTSDTQTAPDAGPCALCPANTVCQEEDAGVVCLCGSQVCADQEVCLLSEDAPGLPPRCCPQGQQNCDGYCTDTQISLQHCGGCQNPCAAGEACISGVCYCGGGDGCDPTSQDCCSGTCRNVLTDTLHCGLLGTGSGCENACSANSTCIQGRCSCTEQSDCSSGWTCCDQTYCVDQSNDPQNCGGCGTPCRLGEACNNRFCVCEGACSDGDPCTEDDCVNNRCTHKTLDRDDDGYCSPDCPDNASGSPGDCFDGDCNDGNREVYPGADEVCNGVDDDCDPNTADGATSCAGFCCGSPVACQDCCEASQCGTASGLHDWVCQEQSCVCNGVDCGGVCFEPGNCCFAADCGAGLWQCNNKLCSCDQAVCADDYCRDETECCDGNDCGDGHWDCTGLHQCICVGELCSDNYCRGNQECCDAQDCGSGHWTCSPGHQCECQQTVCGDGYCPTFGECCSDSDCPLERRHCSLHQCTDCEGVVCGGNCYTGNCCEITDCGPGSWTCGNHSCACAVEQCGSYCRAQDECCQGDDCGSGVWSCSGTFSCICTTEECSDGHCREQTQCCDSADCGLGDWDCNGHECGCTGSGREICSDAYCRTSSECCVGTQCGDGSWDCLGHSCECSGAGKEQCGDGYCRTSAQCCLNSDCGWGHWQCRDHGCSCSRDGREYCSDGYCRDSSECCDSSDCGSGNWNCTTDHECRCTGGNIICGSSCQAPNACGGCAVLTGQPGGVCGTYSCGLFVCSGTDAVVCQGDHARSDYYADIDGDTYGSNIVQSQSLCAADPNGVYTALVAGDCDDGDDERHPAHDEWCDGKDNNCADGTADDGDDECSGGTPNCCGSGDCEECCSDGDCGTGGWDCDSNNTCNCAGVVCSGGYCDEFPVAGGWTTWSWGSWQDLGICHQYTSCLQREYRVGTRSCTSPTPSCGGANCSGSATTTQTRDTLACGDVDGGWSTWSWGLWTTSGTCGDNVACRLPESRDGIRTCTNPAPQCLGSNCSGSTTTTEYRDTVTCGDVDGGWTAWNWDGWVDVGSCHDNVACKQPEENSGTRTCTNPAPACGGADCVGSTTMLDTRDTKDCGLVNGGWSDYSWGSWSPTGSCGQYVACRQRESRLGTRVCNNPTPACGGTVCSGSTTTTETRDTMLCSIAGGWSDWSSWSACSAACGGTQSRVRVCDNPAPSCLGAFCVGDASETQACNPATDCGGGAWTCAVGVCYCGSQECADNYCLQGGEDCCTTEDCGGDPCSNHVCGD